MILFVRIRQFEEAVQQTYSVTFIIIGFETAKRLGMLTEQISMTDFY